MRESLRNPVARNQNRPMHASAIQHTYMAPRTKPASAATTLFTYECEQDRAGVLIPQLEVQLAVRFGPALRGGLDVHAVGLRQTVHRKHIRGGQRTAAVRLKLGTPDAVLGVTAAALAGRIVAIEELWGSAASRQLYARLADAHDTSTAAAILESTIAQRLANTARRHTHAELALAAADKLSRANVHSVAVELGVSERQLRRVFHEVVGVSPKTFAKLTRFRRAVHAARQRDSAGWASIATAAGYYDQAHLIAEFRTIAGVTPRALVAELRTARLVG